MQLAFNIEVREEKEYLLNEEDSKKVMDKAFELAKENKHNLKNNPNHLSVYVKWATQLLLNKGEIEGVLVRTDIEEELTSVWKPKKIKNIVKNT